MYKLVFKRWIDFAAAFLLLLVFAPILAVVWFVLYRQNDGKAFFYQERPGLDQQPFRIIKFKTMTDARDDSGQLLPDNKRITKAGAFFRKWSLDELPQLINVLKGDMSLVGPRPLLFKYIPLYNSTQLRRHEVRPGITGWAQVNGRNSISWTEKFRLDVEYVDQVNLWFDLKILFLTVKKVLISEGVNQTQDRPMLPFDGTN
ncbi:sugar transferase [Flavobacterium sp. CYK-55]|uniref:sugar transferase n=1 Tax=Flavobacterium sp. CYK-55 TaxID=2835529 RepID=UPI001BCDFC27|nr:sugar transferase [Flavobacterium sp. CYK-55]MBS7786421.1 sugar transferase [Flavobacterium sp. CYK-55]